MTTRLAGYQTGALLLVLLAVFVPPLVSCGGGAATNAVLNTAVGVGAAAVQRAQGGCYAACAPGTVCNRKTGYCDPLPCNGRCRVGETCTATPTGNECLPSDQHDLDFQDPMPAQPESAPPLPALQPAPTPPESVP